MSSDLSEHGYARLRTTTIDLLKVLEGEVNLPLGDQPLSVTGSLGKVQVTCMNYGPDAKIYNWQVSAFPDGTAVNPRAGRYLGTVAADSHWPIPTHVFVFRRK